MKPDKISNQTISAFTGWRFCLHFGEVVSLICLMTGCAGNREHSENKGWQSCDYPKALPKAYNSPGVASSSFDPETSGRSVYWPIWGTYRSPKKTDLDLPSSRKISSTPGKLTVK